MRLNKTQKDLLLQWIAEGIKPGEMNKRAAAEPDPFHVDRRQVEYYRKSRNQFIKEITERDEFKALNTGLALSEVRVDKLKQIAELLEADLLNGKLWLKNKKGVGTGPIAEIFNYLEFNRAEVESYRGVLDDIAREVGDRKSRVDVEDGTDGEYRITFVNPYAAGGEEDEK